MSKFFTIITATYNAASTLPRLLDSLAEQTCRDFNVIIQDGASQDNTVAIAESYRDRLPELLLESTPDTGIYDAWNKAIDRCQDKLGEWVLFLGADDTLAGIDIFETVKMRCNSLPQNIIYICGGILPICENSSFTPIFVDVHTSFTNLWRTMLPHPGLFHKKDVFKYKFDSSYKIAGDYDFLVRTWKREFDAISFNKVITNFSNTG